MSEESYSYVDEYNDEKIIDDPNLLTEEKEVFIHLDPQTGKATIESDKSTIVKNLLNHKEAKIKELRKYDGKIVGGSFEVAIGCIKIQKFSRANNYLSNVVSR